MDDRTLPSAVFRCSVCGEQQAVQLTEIKRELGEQDHLRPVPTGPHAPSCRFTHHPFDTVIQIDYLGVGSDA